jgi:hypothetical protein
MRPDGPVPALLHDRPHGGLGQGNGEGKLIIPDSSLLNLNYRTPREACAILRVCRNTLKDMIDDGRVKAVDRRKPGGK